MSIPHSYFKECGRKCTGIEFIILGNILDETVGSPLRADWAALSYQQLANWAGVTEPSVMEALQRLEKKGLIASRSGAMGLRREFRALVADSELAEAS